MSGPVLALLHGQPSLRLAAGDWRLAEADLPPRWPASTLNDRRAASPSSAPDGRRSAAAGERPLPAAEPPPARRPLSVLVVTAAYPAPSEPTRALFIENLCRELSALESPGGGRRFSITVAAPRVHEADPLIESREGIEVRRFDYPSGGRRLKEMGRPSPHVLLAYLHSALRAVLEEATRVRPAVIHCHWLLPAGLVGALAAAALGTPLVVHAHGSEVHRYARGSAAARVLASWTCRRATSVLAVSGALAREMEEILGVPAGRIRLLPMGHDGSTFRPLGPVEREEARRALGLGEGRAELLFVGDLVPEKGGVELAAELAAREPAMPLRLTLAGDGEGRAAAEEAARRAPSRVQVLGRVPPPRLALWYGAADLLVLPSRGEGAPVSVMEALASGLPVMAAAVGGVPELVRQGREGWLVPAGSTPRAFLEAVEEVLGRPGALQEARVSLVASLREDLSATRRARELAPLLEEAAGETR